MVFVPTIAGASHTKHPNIVASNQPPLGSSVHGMQAQT